MPGEPSRARTHIPWGGITTHCAHANAFLCVVRHARRSRCIARQIARYCVPSASLHHCTLTVVRASSPHDFSTINRRTCVSSKTLFNASSTALPTLSTSARGNCGAVAFTPRFVRCDLGRLNTASTMTSIGSLVGVRPHARASRRMASRYACTGCFDGTYARANPPRVLTRTRGCGTGSPGTENVIGFMHAASQQRQANHDEWMISKCRITCRTQ